jgi:Fur family transcriptional regulator, peroxide stress response regulator
MSSRSKATIQAELNERLATGGFRFTPQRRQVYDVLIGKRDHPTAEEVFMRAKAATPDISLATVYNCLDALVKCGLVKHVHVDRGAGRFCPNMHDHCHFHCEECGRVFDVDLTEANPGVPLPRGFHATRFDVSIHGLCPACAKKQ